MGRVRFNHTSSAVNDTGLFWCLILKGLVMSDNEEYKVNCFFCKQSFNFGFHKYYGKHISKYNIDICKNCYDINEDGLNPRYEKTLEEHLFKMNIDKPIRNKNGLYKISGID